MRIRTRLALVLALSLVLAGSFTLVINAIAFDHASYQTWSSYRDALMKELGVPRASAVAFVRAHPEVIFDAPGDVAGPTSKTIDQASRDVQRRAVDAAVARSRRWTVLGLFVVLVSALAAGWLLAGRILRPIRLMTRRARSATALDLGARLALTGPNDEMKELADTFDAMLDRLAQSFEVQRRFSAQVSHELRNPLAVTHSEVEMLLADQDDSVLRNRLTSIADATGRAERLVSQLLVLSRTDIGDLERSSFQLDEMVGNVVGRAVEAPQWRGLRVDLELQPTEVVGDRALLESLVRNLVDNAGRHNQTDGSVRVVVDRPRTDDAPCWKSPTRCRTMRCRPTATVPLAIRTSDCRSSPRYSKHTAARSNGAAVRGASPPTSSSPSYSTPMRGRASDCSSPIALHDDS